MPSMFRGEEVREFPQEDLPVKLSQVPNPPDSVNLANNFPAHIFEPAVLLTPPRQKNNPEFSPLQDGKQASSKVTFFMLHICNLCVRHYWINRIKKALITIHNL